MNELIRKPENVFVDIKDLQRSFTRHTHRGTLLRWIQFRGYTGTRINPSKSGCLRRGSAHLPDQPQR